MCTYEVEDKSTNGVQSVLKLLQHFFPYAQKQLGFHKPVMISFESDEENSNKLLGRTGYYNPDDSSIAIYVDGRHPKDVLRSLSHELIHHTQNCNGEFDAMEDLGPGYAQENPAMRDAELDAYKRGNIILRDFEDLIKKGEINVDIDFEELGEPRMSLKEWKNNELNMLLLKKWGLLKEGGMPTYRDDDKEHDDEEGNRPSMAKDMDLDEQDDPEAVMRRAWVDPDSAENQQVRRGSAKRDRLRRTGDTSAADRISATAHDELGSGEVDLGGTGGVAHYASEAPPHDRVGRYPGHAEFTHKWPKGVKETLTLDEEENAAAELGRWNELAGLDEANVEEGFVTSLQQKLGGWKAGKATGAPKRPGGPAPRRQDPQDAIDSWNPVEYAPDPPGPDPRGPKGQRGAHGPPSTPRSFVGTHSSEFDPDDPGMPKGMRSSRSVKESITLDEARDLARRIFEKLSENNKLSEGALDLFDIGGIVGRPHATGRDVAAKAYRKGGGGKVVRGGSQGQRAKDYAAMGRDPAESPVDVERSMDREESDAMWAAHDDAVGGGRVTRGGSQTAAAKAAARQGVDISATPSQGAVRQHFKAKREKEAAPRAKPAPQELEPGRSGAGTVNVRMPEGKRLNKDALVGKILEKLRKEIK